MVLVLIPLAIAACSDTSATPRVNGGAIRVVTTTTQLTNFAEIIGGSHVHVFGVLKANVDPHDYEPSPADLQQIADADVLVKNGVGLEKWFEGSIKSAGPKGVIVDASTGVKLRKASGSSAEDPHIWQDPRNAKVMVGDIERALEKVDPLHRAYYRGNESRYDKQLDALDVEVESELRALPNKKVITNHDAFGYYLDRYGLDFVGSVIPSFDTQAELSARDIQRIVAKIRSTGAKAVFSESSLPPKTSETIGREAGVKVVAGADSLFGDTLGPPGSDGDTYLKMIRHNTREFVDNLS
jgi:zinc/manganese transport system substrate-binding protein/manganese/iron transport system substrate-binding protein